MKFTKMLTIAIAAFAMVFVGCDKELPTPEKIEAVATVIGKTAGYVCEIAKTKTSVKEGIEQVLDVLSKVVPTEGQTFVEAWTPVIDKELKKLVDDKKLLIFPVVDYRPIKMVDYGIKEFEITQVGEYQNDLQTFEAQRRMGISTIITRYFGVWNL